MLRLKNPKAKPFGALSLYNKHMIRVNDKIYPTGMNYIYSNVLTTPLYQQIVASAPVLPDKKLKGIDDRIARFIADTEYRMGSLSSEEKERMKVYVRNMEKMKNMDLSKVFNYYKNKETEDIARQYLMKAFNQVIKNDGTKEDLLLETGDSHLQSKYLYLPLFDYVASEVLEQLRHSLRIQRKQNETIDTSKADEIYEMFKAVSVINIKNISELDNYSDKDYDDIAKECNVLNCLKKTKETVMEEYRNGKYPFFDIEKESPGYLVIFSILERLRNEKKKSERDQILNVYRSFVYNSLENRGIIDTNEKLRLFEESLSQLYNLNSVDVNEIPKQITDVYEKVKELYEKDKLDSVLQSRVKDIMKNNVDDSMIVKYENLLSTFDEDVDESPKTENNSSSESSDDPLKNILKDKESNRKDFLIKELAHITGKNRRKFMKKSEYELEMEFRKHKGEQGTGVWKLYIKPRKEWKLGKKPILIHESATELSDPDKKNKLVRKFLKSRNLDVKKIIEETKARGISVQDENNISWLAYVKYEDKKDDEKEEEEKEEVADEEKEIFTEENVVLSEENKILYPFFIFETPVVIDNVSFNNALDMLLSVFLSRTQIKKIKNYNIERGMKLEDAYKEIKAYESVEDKFTFFEQKVEENNNNLFRVLVDMAVGKIFQDPFLQELLIFTNDDYIQWNEENILGDETNLIGKALMDMRDIQKEEHRDDADVPLEKENINFSEIIKSDPMINEYIRKNLFRMCNLVADVKKYLLKNGQVNETINADFVDKILNSMYPLKKKYSVVAPHFFNLWVWECKDQYEVAHSSVNDNIRNLNRQLQMEDMNYYGGVDIQSEETKTLEKLVKEQEKEISKATSSKDKKRLSKIHALALEAFINGNQDQFAKQRILASNPNIDPEQLYNEIKEPEIIAVKQKQINAEITNYRVNLTYKLNEDIQKGKYDEDEIVEAKKKVERKITKFANKRYDEIAELRKNIPKTERNLLYQQEREFHEYLDGINSGKIPVDIASDSEMKRETAIARMLEEFKKKQKEEENSIRGKFIHTKEEVDEYMKRRKEILENISENKRKLKTYFSGYEKIMESIGNEYWSRIYSYLRKKKAKTLAELKVALIKDDVISQNLACKDILNDEQKSCIAHALINLIMGVQKVKHDFADTIPFGVADIQFAGTILNEKEIETPENEVEDGKVEEKAFNDGDFIDDGGDDLLKEINDVSDELDDKEVEKMVKKIKSKDDEDENEEDFFEGDEEVVADDDKDESAEVDYEDDNQEEQEELVDEEELVNEKEDFEFGFDGNDSAFEDTEIDNVVAILKRIDNNSHETRKIALYFLDVVNSIFNTLNDSKRELISLFS